MATMNKQHFDTPQATCTCGWESGAKDSWAEVGKAIDEHVAAEKRQAEIREENGTAAH